jgi:phosphoribosylformylglycinamidine synthase
MEWRIEVWAREKDSEAIQLVREIHDLGFPALKELSIARVYFLSGDLSRADASRIARSVFADPVVDCYRVRAAADRRRTADDGTEVEILYNPGVSDPSEASILRAIRELGCNEVEARSGKRYRFAGRLGRRSIERIAEDILYNPLVQHVARPGERIFAHAPEYRFRPVTLEVIGKGTRDLMRISRERQLALNPTEMQVLGRYYRKLGRNPTDIELETFAQTWSEHCKHKTFRGRILVESSKSRPPRSKSKAAVRGRVINDLFKQTIQRVTRELNPDWCLSVFKDNSGVIEFDRRFGITFKVETHNHPSALEPYGGAATGIGGVIRDCLGTGLGAKPILNTDVFCLAPPDLPRQRLPKGVLHPKRVLKGVVGGVRDYGNRMGIPTANGALYFHEDFRCNPLVFCGTLGIIPRSRLAKKIETGDHIVVLGARTGRDGIHGVTFASLELTGESEAVSSSAVQIGNPIEEKKLTDALLKARDLNLFRATTDCGGGGLASAIGELAEPKGAVVDLDRVPLKYQGLSYTEIWISESQERMIVLVSPTKLRKLMNLCRGLDVEATPIGRITSDRRLVLRYQGNVVGELDLGFLHSGWSQQQRIARASKRQFPEPHLPAKRDYTEDLLQLLGSLNVASKEWVIRQYDHEVQGTSVIKPFVGPDNAGPSDGCVIRPVSGSRKGVVIACGLNPRYGLVDPYRMAASAIDEALRNITACGGDPARTAILDNFCWGSPERPEQLAGFVQAARACYDVARGFGTPFISGKDSFYNEFLAEDGKLHPIPPTLLISAVSVIPDCRKAVTSDLKCPGAFLYVLGKTYDELGGSEYYAARGALGSRVPRVRVPAARLRMAGLHQAIERGLVSTVHDISEGGLAVASAEMCLAGELGAVVKLDQVELGEIVGQPDRILFSESNSRFIVEVAPGNRNRFEELMRPFRPSPVGMVTDSGRLQVYDSEGKVLIEADVALLKGVWRNGLSRFL